MAGLLTTTAAPSPAFTQPAEGSVNEIVVTGERPAPFRPLRNIGGQDLSAYGAGTVGELLDRILAEGGDRGEEVTFLVDGKRVTGLGDIDSYPAEALESIELLPRESGAAAGARPGSRVYNVVLKPESRLLVVRGRARAATEGGAEGGTADVSATRIRRPQRLNATLLVRGDEQLLESERGVVQPPGSPAGLDRFRTLRPRTSAGDLRLSAADRLLPWLDGLATLRASESRSNSLLGLGESGFGVERIGRSRAVDLTGQLAAAAGAWTFTLDGSHRQARRRSLTDDGPFAIERSWTWTRTSSLDLLAHGPLIALPTGSAHLTAGATIRRDRVRGLGSTGDGSGLTDTAGELRAGIDVPLSSRSGPWPWLGELALRADVRRGRSDEFGTVRDRTLSLRWSPAEWVHLSAQDSRSRTAPTLALIGEPLIETAGLRYFDPVRRETVDVVAVTGGRNDLPSQESEVRRVTADFRPAPALDLLLTAEYVSTLATNSLSVLPPANDLVVQLFPERFERDAGGRLVRVDLRPVVFPERRVEQLRTGLNLFLPIGPQSRGGRVQVTFSHQLLLSGRLDVGQGFGTVNLLDREAIGFGGALQPRQEFDFTLGYSERGLGLQLSGARRGRSFLGAKDGAGVLTFAPLSTFGLRAFVEGSRIDARSTLLRGSRLGLSVINLANRLERVRDGEGATPLAYQPALRDPVGRSVEVELRKSF